MSGIRAQNAEEQLLHVSCMWPATCSNSSSAFCALMPHATQAGILGWCEQHPACAPAGALLSGSVLGGPTGAADMLAGPAGVPAGGGGG